MAARSAGLLLFRIDDADVVRVLIVHPGGPFWSARDHGAWSVPKGELGEAEDPRRVACREFSEELGAPPPDGEDLPLGEIRQAGGKRVTVWARRGDFDASGVVSNTFEMEWPPRSGRVQRFPEVDRAEWFSVAEARSRLLAAQVEFLDRLMVAATSEHPEAREGVALG